MEAIKEGHGILDMVVRPGFCVKENLIIRVNQAAESLLILPGTDIRDLLLTGAEEYAGFTGGCLYLKLNLTAQGCGAAVVRHNGMDVFLLDAESSDGELRAMALAARELREPLTSMMISANRLAPLVSPEDASMQEQFARLNRGMYQMLRILGNMSDAGRFAAASRQELHSISQLFSEIFEKAQALAMHTGVQLTYEGLQEDLFCMADADQLERAVLNILSNALKFTSAGGWIHARLSRSRKLLQLHVTDSGSGIAENIRGSLFHRYLRQPGIEDGRYGIGLGMVLVRSVAANHGGTVLVDQPDGCGTRITMTLAVRRQDSGTLRSPILHVDYTGERDHALVELSDCLPSSVYKKETE